MAEDVLAVASDNILEVRIYIDTYVDMEDRFFSFGVMHSGAKMSYILTWVPICRSEGLKNTSDLHSCSNGELNLWNMLIQLA